MKRVLFVFDTLNTGGAEKSILEIVSRFRKYHPIVCHLYPGSELKQLFENAGIEVISLQTPGHYNFLTALRSFEQVVSSVKPQIVHSTLFRADIVSRLAKIRNHLPLISSLVNNSYHATRFRNASLTLYLKLRGIQLLDALTAKNVDIFVSNSEAIRTENSKKLAIPLNKIRVIYRGRASKDFGILPEIDQQDLKRNLSLLSGPILLNVSRLLDRKGQLDLIRAFKDIVSEYPGAFLIIAGEGPFRARLETEIKKLNLTDKVHLLGNRRDIPALLKISDAFVFPSYYEGLPGALIEAMFAQIPIVASDIPENLECVDRDSAYLYPVGHIEALVTAVKMCISQPEKSAAQAKLGLTAANEKFRIEEIAMRYEMLYDEVLSS